jgi:hypothetical protein
MILGIVIVILLVATVLACPLWYDTRYGGRPMWLGLVVIDTILMIVWCAQHLHVSW